MQRFSPPRWDHWEILRTFRSREPVGGPQQNRGYFSFRSLYLLACHVGVHSTHAMLALQHAQTNRLELPET